MRLRTLLPALAVVLGPSCDRANDDVRSSVVEVLRGVRMIRPRLVGDDPRSACPERGSGTVALHRMRCGVAPPDRERVRGQLEPLATDLYHRITDVPDVSDLQAAAVWQLLWPGDTTGVDEAVGFLQRALAQDQSNAALHSDLAAALLLRADADTSLDDLLRAYASAEEAVRIAPTMAEAHFNRALALEALTLSHEASQAWAAYTRAGGDPVADGGISPTAPPRISIAEYRRQLRSALDEGRPTAIDSLVASQPVGAYLWAVDALLPEWAEAQLGGGDQADTLVMLLATVAESVARFSGDSMLADVVGAVQGDPVANAAAVSRLALARAQYVGGRAEAWQTAESARIALTRSLNPLRHFAAFISAAALHVRGEYDAAFTAMARLRDDLTRRPYGIQSGRTDYVLGLIRSTQGRRGEAIEHFQRALESLSASDHTYRALTNEELGILFNLLRSGRQAGRYHLRALVHQDAALGDASSQLALLAVGDYASSRVGPAAALPFYRENLARQRADDVARVSMTLLETAEALDRFGRPEEAMALVDSAEGLIEQIDAGEVRAEREMLASLIQGELLAQFRPADAIEPLDSAVLAFRRTEHRTRLVRAELALARAHVADDNYQAALTSFVGALRELERQRAFLDSTSHRRNFFDRVRPVFDELVAFHLDQDDPDAALAVFEQMRGRVLFDRLQPEGARPWGEEDLDAVSAGLGDQQVVLAYAVLPDRLVTWVFTSQGREFRVHAIPVDALRTLVANHRTAIERRDSATASALGVELYDLLIRPIEALGARREVIVVPDDHLHLVPFGALRDSVTGRFFVESHTITIVAGLRHRGFREHDPQPLTDSARALIVGKPSYDNDLFGLPDIPESLPEAREVAREWLRPTLVTGEEATADRFLAEAADADVIHFAGHAVADPDNPDAGFLLLASPEGGVRVTADQVARMTLRHRPLVILSACQTSAGLLSASEGPTSLARAFLAAGSGQVVASLWPIDDDLTAQFFIGFHRRLVLGLRPDEALRDTQLEFIERNNDPRRLRVWSAFQLYGGS